MDSKQSLHMNTGEGEASYAQNSHIQRAVQKKINHIVEDAATDLMRKFTNAISSIVIADLGCSSGPNAVALISVAVEAIFRYCALEQKAPEDLMKGGIPMYDADDDLRQERRPLVLEAYARKFRKDFTLFLNLRAQELVPGGQMQGVVEREKLDSFYIPMYGPSDKELRKIIEDESSFTINNILAHEVMNDMDRSSITPKMMALAARAAYEPIIVQHFGATVVEEFERTVELHVRAGTPQLAAAGLVFLSVSLTKKV
nr:unnamed protein product [Digitaria exilis]